MRLIYFLILCTVFTLMHSAEEEKETITFIPTNEWQEILPNHKVPPV